MYYGVHIFLTYFPKCKIRKLYSHGMKIASFFKPENPWNSFGNRYGNLWKKSVTSKNPLRFSNLAILSYSENQTPHSSVEKKIKHTQVQWCAHGDLCETTAKSVLYAEYCFSFKCPWHTVIYIIWVSNSVYRQMILEEKIISISWNFGGRL